MGRINLQTKPNNSFNASTNSGAFIRETSLVITARCAALILSLGARL
jgi:hypothetical protein